MRRIIISTFLFACLPAISHAQNYIPNGGYSGAGVVVNMDVLNAAAPSSPQPIMSQNLPPVAAPPAPIVLRPPQAVPMPAPVMPAPQFQQPAPIAPPAPVLAPMTAPPPAVIYDTPAATPQNPGRQALGSLHDAPEEETPAAMPAPAPKMVPSGALTDEMAPVSPPALPSPIMGKPDEALKPVASIPAAPVAPPVAAKDDFEAYRLFFDPSSDMLKPTETAVLDKVAGKLNSDTTKRLQVRAYANGTPDNAGAARRLSLTRALKVRDYLIQKNIATTRLDIRALGSGSAEMGDQVGSTNAPPDRVDVVFTK